jgi:transcription-repair coupling factor (superfamily II helicase)
MKASPARDPQSNRNSTRRTQKRLSRTSNQSAKNSRLLPVSSSSPLGLLALHLLEQWECAKDHGLVFVAEDERRAEQLGAILSSLAPSCGVMVLPRQDGLPYDGLEPSPEISGRRASVLRRLAMLSKPLLVATAEALLERVPPRQAWQRATLNLRTGDPLDRNDFESFLARAGYSLEDRVDAPGAAVLLGQTVEIYPAGGLAPVRLSVSDGRIDDIHTYELETMREVDELSQVTLDPVSEWAEIVQPNDDAETISTSRRARTSPLSYLPSARLILDFGVRARASNWIQLPEEARNETNSNPFREGFLTLKEWEDELWARYAWTLAETSATEVVPNFASSDSPTRSLRAFLQQQQKLGASIVFTAATEGDLRTMDRRAGGSSERCSDWQEALRRKAGTRTSLIVDFETGFIWNPGRPVVVITATDVMGSRAARQNPMAPIGDTLAQDPSDLKPGDVAVHMDRGFSIVAGLETVRAASVPETEMVRLEFANNEMVLLPVDELRDVWRYSSDQAGISLDKADGSSWRKRRLEVEREITETAAHLSTLLAERELRAAPKIVPPTAEYERFAARFPHFPTPDQSKAIEEVLQDLASGRPMDRLVCGDVGYGKTEIALRATAAAVFSGKQVAIAVPTTVLARQHVQTFRKRFAPFGIEIGQLSRFATDAEARAVRKSLKAGRLRVVVGTHALASKSVQFADLGLLVVDEEQRFGTTDKAKLARLGECIHLLTMTATPIPRTLNQLNAGIRSVSAILTPPVRRIPVQTVAQTFDEGTVVAALRRERRRLGQSFVVCPKISDIDPMLARLHAIVPELSVAKVHGKMAARDIEETMMDFAAGKTDVLLTTNIIESGLDLPRANTIVVWRPEQFGLAQLHQLRGRVGRSGRRAFAYFMSDPASPETKSSTTRLQVLCETNRPGAGLEISRKDLDLRGGGDLLSERQSGHVKALGPALYKHLLERAMSRLGGDGSSDQHRPQLRLDIPRLLPKEYIQNDAARLEIYARISKCASERELDQIEDELEERFGGLPVEARNLIATAQLELDCLRLGVLQIDAGPDAVAATLRDPALTQIKAAKNWGSTLVWNDGRLVYRRQSPTSERLVTIRNLVDLLEAVSQSA